MSHCNENLATATNQGTLTTRLNITELGDTLLAITSNQTADAFPTICAWVPLLLFLRLLQVSVLLLLQRCGNLIISSCLCGGQRRQAEGKQGR